MMPEWYRKAISLIQFSASIQWVSNKDYSFPLICNGHYCVNNIYRYVN